MKPTVAQLIVAGLSPKLAETYVQPLADAMARFDIDSAARIGAFLGQCIVESEYFTRAVENLYYSDPARIYSIFPSHFKSSVDAIPYAKNPQKLGARVYANRLGNGDEASGEGYTYRGRALIQLTGKANYADASSGLAKDFVAHPDFAEQPADACLISAWFWHTHKLNYLADAGDTNAITLAINGRAMLAADKRLRATKQAIGALA